LQHGALHRRALIPADLVVTMSDQFDLFGTREFPANPIEARFWEFHDENPRVYRLFDRFTRQAIARGHDHLSADMVMHRIRWESAVETTDGEFKVNNNYSAYYGRLWMRENPGFAGFFRTRKLLNGDASDALKVNDAA
jgi:hypothetical protein